MIRSQHARAEESMIEVHTDVVGSLLRPPWLLETANSVWG